MQTTLVPFDQVPQFSPKDVAYASGHPNLRPFFKYDVALDQFPSIINDKKKEQTDRATLVRVLQKQHAGLQRSLAVQKNINALLDENTFTVTTAHQPSLFTGPLYYVLKVASTIHLATLLNKTYPQYRFVPVFINGGEDHDFEEVNHAHIFGKTINWKNKESGSVGKMKVDTLKAPLTELKEILGESERAKEIYSVFERAYTSHKTYAEATNHLVHELFGKFGLLGLNTTDPELKALFAPITEEELFEQPSQQFIEKAQKQLTEAGFSGQAHAREINLFYLRDQIRNRIVLEDETYKVLDTDYTFSRKALLQELEEHPERFSPNVVLRPLYQELILPNLAYIGGGGEISYWLERKEQFDHFSINFPMLIRRNSVLWIDKGSQKKMEKNGLELHDLFRNTEVLLQEYVRKNTENEINLTEEKAQLETIFDQIAQKAVETDPTLEKKVLAENAKILNSVEKLEERLMRAEKQRYETALNQIRSLKDKLFPNNGLQERHDNFLNFYLKHGPAFFDILVEHLNPLQKGLVVILDE